jgi:hypothetical protein
MISSGAKQLSPSSNPRWVTSQNSEGLKFIAAEACDPVFYALSDW